MATQLRNIATKTLSILIFLLGLSACLLVAVFLFTGMDELVYNGKISIHLLGFAGFWLTFGISSIIISTSKKKRAPRFLLYLLLIFFVLIIVGFFNS